MRQQNLAPNGRTHSPGMREITTYHSLYPPVGDDAAKRTSGKSWKLLLW